MKLLYFLAFYLLPSTATGLFNMVVTKDGVVANATVPAEVVFEPSSESNLRKKIPGLTTYRNRDPRIRNSDRDCKTYRVYYDRDDFNSKILPIMTDYDSRSIGYTVEGAELFDAKTDKLVALVSETGLLTPSDDCSGTGTFTFNPRSTKETKDQIFYQGKLRRLNCCMDLLSHLTNTFLFVSDVRHSEATCNCRRIRHVSVCCRNDGNFSPELEDSLLRDSRL